MERLGRKFVIVLWVLSMFIVVAKTEEIIEGQKEEGEQVRSSSSSVLMDAISLLTVRSAAAPPPFTSYWGYVRWVFDTARARLFPPKIDFLEGREAFEGDGIGGTERVKEAISKTMEKSKETVEDSAKSAAKTATETVQHTKEKVKQKILSTPPQESEL